MSFQAMTWADGQVAGGPSAKATLFTIANIANEHGVAWPSQELLAERSEQSVDSVGRRLRDLADRGLVRRIPLKFAGRKTVDFIVLACSAFFRAPLADLEPLLPRGCTVDPRYGEPPGEGSAAPEDACDAHADCGNVDGAALPQTLPQSAAHAPATVREQEPVMEPKEPLRESADARAGGREGGERPWVDDAAFLAAAKAWGPIDVLSRSWQAWTALPAEEQALAARRIASYQALHRKRSLRCAFSTYLRERQFDLLPDPEPGPDAPPAMITLPPRTRHWWARILPLAAAGDPKAMNRVRLAAEHDCGFGVPLAEAPDDAEVDALVGLEVGWDDERRVTPSPPLSAWLDWLVERGVPRTALTSARVLGRCVFVPAEWPPEGAVGSRQVGSGEVGSGEVGYAGHSADCRLPTADSRVPTAEPDRPLPAKAQALLAALDGAAAAERERLAPPKREKPPPVDRDAWRSEMEGEGER